MGAAAADTASAKVRSASLFTYGARNRFRNRSASSLFLVPVDLAIRLPLMMQRTVYMPVFSRRSPPVPFDRLCWRSFPRPFLFGAPLATNLSRSRRRRSSRLNLIPHPHPSPSSSRPPCDELEVAVPRNADGAFAAAVNALQVAALDVVIERPTMDLEPLQHVLVADDVCEVLVQSALQICDGLLDILGRDALVACDFFFGFRGLPRGRIGHAGCRGRRPLPCPTSCPHPW